MTEKITQLHSFRVEKHCPNCADGFMVAGYLVLMTMPPAYPHICEKCGHRKDYKIKYPYVDHQQIIPDPRGGDHG